MPGVENTALNFINAITPLAWVVVVLGIMTAGIIFGFSGEKGKEKAKPWLIGAFLAGFLIIGGLQIAQWFVSNIAF